MTRRTLTARWVLPVDGPPRPGGSVLVEDGRILAVSDFHHAEGPVEDLGDAVLLPGLVNAHTHLEFSDLSQPLGRPGMELPAWIALVIAERKRGDRHALANIASGLRESLAWGVTTVGDIVTSVGVNQSPSPLVLKLHEVIGFSAGRVESALADLCGRLDEDRSRSTVGNEYALYGVSPHAPYTVNPRLLERLVDLACARSLPLAMHLAESRAEGELITQGSGPFRQLLDARSMWDSSSIPLGSTSLDYLRRLSRAPRVLVIHGNYLEREDIIFLGEQSNMSVVYCPRTHGYFQHEDYPLAEFRAAGVRVALGTDSRASNPDLNLMAEVRTVVGRHSLAPADALQMGTLDAAEALGLAALIGSITPGKRADLIALPCAGSDPYDAVLVHEGQPLGVWLSGERLPAIAPCTPG